MRRVHRLGEEEHDEITDYVLDEGGFLTFWDQDIFEQESLVFLKGEQGHDIELYLTSYLEGGLTLTKSCPKFDFWSLPDVKSGQVVLIKRDQEIVAVQSAMDCPWMEAKMKSKPLPDKVEVITVTI